MVQNTLAKVKDHLDNTSLSCLSMQVRLIIYFFKPHKVTSTGCVQGCIAVFFKS